MTAYVIQPRSDEGLRPESYEVSRMGCDAEVKTWHLNPAITGHGLQMTGA